MKTSEKQGSPNRTSAPTVQTELNYVSKSWIHAGPASIAVPQKVAGGLPKMMFFALLPCTGLQLFARSNSLTIN
jgi:hypothetical protein